MSQVTVPQGELPVWSMTLNCSRHKCFQILRRLELEAYSKIVSVFRAQGCLTGEKRKVLYKLQRLLSITTDRHKAEVRRALNDEELITISEAASGKEVYEDWILEGKRVAPILHRPSPKTAYLAEANRVAFDQLCENYATPPPCETAYLNLTPERTKSEQQSASLSAEENVYPKTFAHKSTQTTKFPTESSPVQFVDGESHEADSIPRVGCEVTCETESLAVAGELPNGHVKQKPPFVVDSQSVSTRGGHDSFEGQTESCPNHQLIPDRDSSRLSLSAQLNSAHGVSTNVPLPNFGKSNEVTQVSDNKPNPVETLPLGANGSRKRSLSSSPSTTEGLTTSSKLLSLVHAPNTLTTAARRPVQPQLILGNQQHEATLNSSNTTQALSRVPEPASVNYTTTQKGQTKATHGVIGLPSSSTNRSHSQLVLQMCRPASDSLSNTDSTVTASRSGNTVIIPPRPGQLNTVARSYSGTQLSGSNLSFKSPLIGPRVQRSMQSSLSDPVTDPSQRTYSSTTTPSMAMVHSLQAVAGTQRLPTTLNTVVLSTSSINAIPGSHGPVQPLASPLFKPNSISISNNHIATLSNNPVSSTTMDVGLTQSSMAARRLVSSAQPLIVPGLQVSMASSVLPNTTTPPANSNVIVFQRAVGNRKSSSMCPTPIKLTSAVSGPIPSTSTSTTSTGTGASGSRHIRILGLSSNTFPAGGTTVVSTSPSSLGTVSITSVTRATHDIPTSPPVNTDSVLTNLSEIDRLQSDTVSTILSRASRLGAMLEVDLDADDYVTQPSLADASTNHGGSSQHTDPSLNPTLLMESSMQSNPSTTNELHHEVQESTSPVPGQPVVTESEGAPSANRTTTTRVSNNPQSVDTHADESAEVESSANPEHSLEERDSFDSPIEVPTNKKIDQLKAILGLTTHGASGAESREELPVEPSKSVLMGPRSHPPCFDQASCSTSENWGPDRPSLTGCVVPEAKRARLSPGFSDAPDLNSSPPEGRRITAMLQHALEPNTLGVEARPDPVLP